MRVRPARSTLFPYTTLFRSEAKRAAKKERERQERERLEQGKLDPKDMFKTAEYTDWDADGFPIKDAAGNPIRSEEHTSELQSLTNIVCRLLLEKKKQK